MPWSAFPGQFWPGSMDSNRNESGPQQLCPPVEFSKSRSVDRKKQITNSEKVLVEPTENKDHAKSKDTLAGNETTVSNVPALPTQLVPMDTSTDANPNLPNPMESGNPVDRKPPEYKNMSDWKLGEVFDYSELDKQEEEEQELEGEGDEYEDYAFEQDGAERDRGSTIRFGWEIKDFIKKREEWMQQFLRKDPTMPTPTKKLHSPATQIESKDGKTPLNWRLMMFPYGNPAREHKAFRSHISVYVEITNHEDLKAPWSTKCKIDIVALNCVVGNAHFHSKCENTFNPRTQDWGFSMFLEQDKITKEDGFLDENGTLRLEARIRQKPDYQNHLDYNSKAATGMVGLRNLGATCYLNSLLQTLFHTRKLRLAVYDLDTSNDDSRLGVALGLQRLFWSLQTSDAAVETRSLTQAFGWDSYQCFMQHDIQELNRELCDKLEERMKGTPQEGTIKWLFTGRYRSYIKCINVDYESSRDEEYYDIQLDIKGMANVKESFKKYVEVEKLEGENQYEAEGYGKQDADKGVGFLSFPRVLHLHLKRFEYNMMTDNTVKINDRYEFPLRLNLNEFLHKDAPGREDAKYEYVLHSVLVHSGDVNAGHYYAYINTMEKSKQKDGEKTWYKFDDENVIRVKEKRAVNATFGGEYSSRDARAGTKKFSNAYMLVYIQECMLDKVLPEITDASVNTQLVKRFEEEKMLEERANKERTEMRTYAHIRIVREKDLKKFHKYSAKQTLKLQQATHHMDFVDYSATELVIKVKKDDPPFVLYKAVARALGVTTNDIRLWRCVDRENQTRRVDNVISRRDTCTRITKAVEAHFISMEKPGEVFCEELKVPESNNKVEETEPDLVKRDLQDEDDRESKKPRLEANVENGGHENGDTVMEESDVLNDANVLFGEIDDCDRLAKGKQILLFIRYYDKNEKDDSMRLKHLGHIIVETDLTFGDVVLISQQKFPILKELDQTKCTVNEILTPSRIESHNSTVTLASSDMQNGDILVIESSEAGPIPDIKFKSVKDWMFHHVHHVIVDFYHLDKPGVKTCTLDLEFNNSYPDVARKLGMALREKYKDKQSPYDFSDDGRIHMVGTRIAEPNFELNCTLLKFAEPTEEELSERRFSLFWEILPCRLDSLQLDQETVVKVTVLRGYENSENASLVVATNATVSDLMLSIREKLTIPESSGLRLFQIYAGRFDRELSPNDSVNSLNGNRRHKSRIIAEVDDEFSWLPGEEIGVNSVVPMNLSKPAGDANNVAELQKTASVAVNGESPEKTLALKSILVLVCHFYTREDEKNTVPKAVLFDLPFTLRVRPNETVECIRKRIEKRVKMPEEKFQELKLVGFLRGATERFKELDDDNEKLLENQAMFPGSIAQDIATNIRTSFLTQVPMLGLLHSSKDVSEIDNDSDLLEEFDGSPVYAIPQRNDSFRDLPTGGLTIRSS